MTIIIDQEETTSPEPPPPDDGFFHFSHDELFQWPLPSSGFQKRLSSPLLNEWVCFAPGYPAWVALA